LSPLIPGSEPLEALAAESLDEAVALAPPGTEERRAVLAHLLRALRPGGRLTALAPKDRGGSRLGKELIAFGCGVSETARRHHRICITTRPDSPAGLESAIQAGAPRLEGGLWTWPGVFSWKAVDPGSALLARHLPALSGRGADLGCGVGVLAHPVLRSPRVESLLLVDIDRRAVECARRNVDDPRATFAWADVLQPHPGLATSTSSSATRPFHHAGAEDRRLGQAFVRRAHGALRRGGTLHLVANRHLPYEGVLSELFAQVSPGGRLRRLQGAGGAPVSGTVRLDKLLANLGYGSRREVQALAGAGRVKLDGEALSDAERRIALTPDLARAADVSGRPLDPLPGLALMLHKPLGTTCSHKEDGPIVYDLLPERWRRREPAISTVGRLDKDTSGLLLLTDDGALLHRIISPKSHLAKRYRATLAPPARGRRSRPCSPRAR
jgi:16S rRNA (guanine1207-N2)-methyltransferase